MSKQWLEALLAESKAVTEEQEDLAETEQKPGQYDHVVGVAVPDLRKIFFVSKQYHQNALEIASSLILCDPKERKKKESDLARLHLYAEAVRDIFWISCRHAFPELWDKPSIGIRKGWQIVWSEEPDERHRGMFGGVGATFRKLFGGGDSGDPDEEAEGADGSKTPLN